MAFIKRKKKQIVTTKKIITVGSNNEATRSIVDDFISCQKNLFEAFEIDKQYHVKSLIGSKWTINDFDDGKILRYWITEDKFDDCVIVKENGDSVIREYEGFSIVIALDCVKTAFMFKTVDKI